MEVALINEELFKENSPIKEDTIISKFVPYILIAQKMYIRKVLGQPLYDELQTQIKAASVVPSPDPNPITPENRALIRQIAPALAFYAVYQGLPFHWAAIENKGITVRESENSKGIALNDLAQLRRWLRDDAQQWTAYLIDYLRKCGKYPLWSPPSDSCGQDPRTASPFESGFYFPKRRR